MVAVRIRRQIRAHFGGDDQNRLQPDGRYRREVDPHDALQRSAPRLSREGRRISPALPSPSCSVGSGATSCDMIARSHSAICSSAKS